MSLVGDMVIASRELIPDMPDVLPVPAATASVVSSTGSTLPAGTYYVVVTQWNPWGQTLYPAEIGSLTVGANQGIKITSALLPGATRVRAYLTQVNGASGSESQFVDSTTSPFTIAAPPSSSGTPPTRSTAFLPDDDGSFLSAGTIFRWINEALHRGSRMVNGILDYTGVASVQGQALYALYSQWSQITSIWYDGFPLNLGSREYFFRRNSIQASVLASATVSVQDDRTMIEVFYQPVRSAGITTLGSGLGIGDTVANVLSTADYLSLAPPMMAMIGTLPNVEIVAFYNFTGTQLQGLVRGLGGTSAAAWPAGTSVQELNIPVSGRRVITSSFQPGDSSLVANIPQGWRSVVPEYVLYRARLAEQMDKEANQHYANFKAAIEEWGKANRQIAGPRSISIYPRGAEVVPGYGTPLGGVVLP